MEHIVQFGISIDDQRIANSIESNAEREITDKLYKDVEEVIFGRYHCPSDFVRDKMDDFLAENCDKIVDIAGNYLADKLMRTKRGKALLEKYESVED